MADKKSKVTLSPEADMSTILRVVKVAKDAVLKQKPVASDLLEDLRRLNLLKPSTTFRGTELFPGEAWILPYSFDSKGKTHRGFIGFDKNYRLLSIDDSILGEEYEYGRKLNRIYLGKKEAEEVAS